MPAFAGMTVESLSIYFPNFSCGILHNSMMKVALAQLCSSTNKGENLRVASEFIKNAKSQGVSLIAFPEFLMAYSPTTQSAEELCGLAEIVDGPFTTALRKIAKAAEINVVATIYERSDFANRVYDTALWIGRDGNIAAAYRKLHLYDALGFKESDKFVAGSDLTAPIETELGNIGIMICYDLRFPELSRLLTLMEANILLAPSGWIQGEMKVEHWQTMVRARALENGCYMIAPAQVGNIYIGHSMVVDPFGRTVAEMGGGEGLEVVEIDLGMVSEVREKLPLLKNRRAEIYARYASAGRFP
jgi:deaminated glutathione amidase